MNSSETNSIKIKVYRGSTFLSRVQGKEVDDYLSMSNVSVGSYFESRLGGKVGTGKLTQQEINVLLPPFVEVDSTHPEFMKRVNEFYHALDTKIPFGTGLELEIGLLDNSKKVGDTIEKGKLNVPLDFDNYLRYRHIAGHPDTALTKEEADSNPNKKYYIFNPDELKRKQKLRNEEIDAANQKFLEIKGDINKVKMALTLLGENLKSFIGKDREVQMEQKLRTIVNQRPADFVGVLGTKDLELRFFIQELVNNKIIQVVNGKYIDPDAPNAKASLLANDLDEFITYLSLDENSALMIRLKAALQEKSIDYKTVE